MLLEQHHAREAVRVSASTVLKRKQTGVGEGGSTSGLWDKGIKEFRKKPAVTGSVALVRTTNEARAQNEQSSFWIIIEHN